MQNKQWKKYSAIVYLKYRVCKYVFTSGLHSTYCCFGYRIHILFFIKYMHYNLHIQILWKKGLKTVHK